jgi:hypothetical protein
MVDDIKFTKYGFMNHDQCWLSIGWHVKIIDFSLKLLLRVQNQKFELKVCWGCHIATIFHLSMNVFKVLWLHFKVASCVMKTFMHKFVFKEFWNIILSLPLWASISCCNLWMNSKCFVHHCLGFLVACHMVLKFWTKALEVLVIFSLLVEVGPRALNAI